MTTHVTRLDLESTRPEYGQARSAGPHPSTTQSLGTHVPHARNGSAASHGALHVQPPTRTPQTFAPELCSLLCTRMRQAEPHVFSFTILLPFTRENQSPRPRPRNTACTTTSSASPGADHVGLCSFSLLFPRSTRYLLTREAERESIRTRHRTHTHMT